MRRTWGNEKEVPSFQPYMNSILPENEDVCKMRVGVLTFRADDQYTYFSLNYEPRVAEHLYRKKIRLVLDRIGFKYGYDSRWNNQYKVWVTAIQVAEQMVEDKDWFKKNDIEISERSETNEPV